MNQKQHSSVQHTRNSVSTVKKQTLLLLKPVEILIIRNDLVCPGSLYKIDDFQVLQVCCITWACCVLFIHTGIKYFQCTLVSRWLYKYSEPLVKSLLFILGFLQFRVYQSSFTVIT